jgi:hypothetical protein
VQELPEPTVTSCYFDKGFSPQLSAMRLRWPLDGVDCETWKWHLPESIIMPGPPPRIFGIRIERQAEASYSVSLLWNRTCLRWHSLKPDQIIASDLRRLLSAMGTDLMYLLDQPVREPQKGPHEAA